MSSTDSSARQELRDQQAATNRAKEEALRTYDEALRTTGHPEAGSAAGDKVTEIAYAASHRVDEAANTVKDAVHDALNKLQGKTDAVATKSDAAPTIAPNTVHRTQI